MATPILPPSLVRPFNNDDYLCFGGAERFAYGSQAPVIYEGSDRIIAAGRYGVEVMFGDSDADRFSLVRDSLTKEDAILIIELVQFASRSTLRAIGFVCNG